MTFKNYNDEVIHILHIVIHMCKWISFTAKIRIKTAKNMHF